MTRERHEPPSSQLGKDGSAKAGNAVPGVVNDAHLPNVITDAADFGDQPHALRKIVAKSPEIDDIAAAAQGGSTLDDCRFVAGRLQPEGQRRPCNACARDQDRFHDPKLSQLIPFSIGPW